MASMATVSGLGTAQRNRRRNRQERLWLLAACLALAALLAAARTQDWHQVQQDENARLQALVAAAEVNLARRLDSVFAALVGVRSDRPAWVKGDMRVGAARRMRALKAAMPGVRQLALLDAQGRVLASSGDPAEVLGSLPPGFVARHALAADPVWLNLEVPAPLAAHGEGASTLPVAGRSAGSGVAVLASVAVWDQSATADETRAFSGVMLALLDGDYFSTGLQPMLYASDMVALLVHADGTLVAQTPGQPSRVGLKLNTPQSLFTRHRQGGGGSSIQRARTLVSGGERLAALQDLLPRQAAVARPMVLAMSRNPAAVHADWRQQTALQALGLGLLAALAWVVLLQQQRRRRLQLSRQAQAEREQALQAERLALALAGADLALWDSDLRTGRAVVDARWFQMLGFEDGAFDAQRGWAERVHPEDLPVVQAAHRAHEDGQTPGYEATYRLRHALGHWVWVLARGRVVERGSDGRGLRMVGTHMDVTERMQAQEALRHSEQSLAITLSSIGDAVIATDTAGCVTRMNPAAERLTGWPLAQAQGRRLAEVFRIFNAHTRAPLADPVALVLAHGEIVGLANDTVLVARDGSERQIADSAAPIRGPADATAPGQGAGEVLGVVLVFSDVTEQYRMLQALRDRERQFASVAEALPGAVSRMDRQGRYLYANRAYARWFGLAPGDIVGRTHREVLGEGRYAHVAGQVQRVLSGQPVQYESALRTAAGERLYLLVNQVPDHDEAGALTGYFTIATDITERKEAEEDLRRSESRLRLAGRIARLGGWRLEAEPLRFSLTPESLRILQAGVADEGQAPSGDGLRDFDGALALVEPADRERTRAALRRSLDTGEPFDQQLSVNGATEPRRLRLMGEAERDAGGRVLALQGAMQDITEQEQGRQQLQLLQASVAQLNDVVLVTEAQPLDEPGPRIVFVNQAVKAMTGRAPHELLGRSPRVLQGPLTQRAELQRIRQALAAGRPVRAELINYHRSGLPYWIELVVAPVFDDQGRASHFVAVQRDISARKQAEEGLRELQQALQATLEAVPDLLFELDLDGRILSQHSPRAELLLQPPEQFLGRPVGEVLPPDAASAMMDALRQAHAQGRSSGQQYSLPLAAGSRWFELSVSRKPTPPGQRPRFIALARDISERKRADEERQTLERQLREAQKMESIGTLAGGIAHDFNNILAAILGNVALARDDLPDGHAALTSLEQIQRAGQRARSLVQQILTFSRRGPQTLSVQPLRAVVDETLSLLRATLPAGVRLDTRLADEALPVLADATQLPQVLMNLCTNAWHALHDSGGRIEVGLQALPAADAGRAWLDAQQPVAGLQALPAGDCAHLWVRDEGRGIDAASLKRIFDPFFTTKPVGQGTGLGLSVVLGIVNTLNGALRLETAPGQGSCFHVLLPLVPGGTPQALVSTVAAGAPGAATVGRVLYVDDDEVMLLMVQRLLERAGHQVLTCSHAQQALDLLADPAQAVDLLVTDFNMPELSGLDLCRRTRALRPALPMVISSGYISERLRGQADTLGVRALVMKEHTLDELPALVQRLLRRAGD